MSHYTNLTNKEVKEAIGKSVKGREFELGKNFFEKLPMPETEDDWLSNYDEDFQPLSDFKQTAPTIPKDKSILYLVPVGIPKSNLNPKIGQPAYPDVNLLLEYSRVFFASNLKGNITDVVLLENLVIEKETQNKHYMIVKNEKCEIKSRKGLDHDEIQLNLNDIIKGLKNVKPKDAFHLCGMTMYDLYKDESDLYLAGWNQAGLHIGLFSFARYDEFYLQRAKDKIYHTSLVRFNKKIKQDKKERIKLILKRSIKTITHEILHGLGFGHCIYYKCLMNGSGNIDEDDAAPFHLCVVCLSKFNYSIKTNLLERYENLLKFHQENDIKKEEEWLTARIEFIKNKRKRKETLEIIEISE